MADIFPVDSEVHIRAGAEERKRISVGSGKATIDGKEFTSVVIDGPVDVVGVAKLFVEPTDDQPRKTKPRKPAKKAAKAKAKK